ncbi:aftiphilin a isoform X1 [Hypomesus transpacificus]|uniref:aftiphilin a isoform X1 n=1 Tax=Hypomesus transpacificus TaxID=137520 RepID=UPI001F088761|nr:aftiphilin a isoform X1 [Hypomesus transpacificus]
MEPDVIRMYSSSPPPMEDGAEEEDDEFGDFGGFSGVPNSVSFTEFDTPATFNQNQALTATSPPELLNNGGVVAISNLSCGSVSRGPAEDLSKTNGVVPGGDGSPSDRTVNTEDLKRLADHSQPNHHSNSLDLDRNTLTDNKPLDCNGGVVEVLTNGFASFEVQEIPLSSQHAVHPHPKGTSTESPDECPPSPEEDDFADFAAFSNADIQGHLSQSTNLSENTDCTEGGDCLAEGADRRNSNTGQESGSEDIVRDCHETNADTPGPDSISHPAVALDRLSNGDGVFHTDGYTEDRDIAFAPEPSSSEALCTREPVAQNGMGSEGSDEALIEENGVSPDTGGDREGEQADEKSSGNETETETETETSFGRPLSTEALEEYGDMSTTGSVPSPPLQEEMATPVGHSQLAEDDEDFGEFGDVGSFGGQGFADFEQPETQEDCVSTGSNAVPAQELGDDEDFGDFDSPHNPPVDKDTEDREEFTDFPGSDSFADFSSAAVAGDTDADAGWNAFHEPEQGQGEGDSWAAFGGEQSAAPSEKSEDEWQESGAVTSFPSIRDDASRRESLSASLSCRLEKLFQATFPETPVPQVGEEVLSLKTRLEPPERLEQEEDGKGSATDNRGLWDVWRQLQDIHNSFGLRHQWGGSHSNKTLLCSLGIDTRNILFTGQKKQPVIVPMYAASLGMLEPTKEPVKPISAAEMIASIAQAPPVAPEISTCPPDTAQQETLPPVQFDWSSSGLTNPLDGVDPELYELTTAKMDPSGSGSRVADAFARLMSTMDKTSTSTKKPRKEENLSEEAAKVIACLPDLSFMQAKVLMFPTTLRPLGCSEPMSD